MYVNKLQKFRNALRKTSVILVTLGLLFSSYGVYLSTGSTTLAASQTTTVTPTSVPGSDFCKDLTISGTTLYPGGTLTMTAKSTTKNIIHFAYGLYNRDNEYSSSNPKPIYFTPETHYVIVQTTPPTDTNTVTIKYDDVNKPDINFNGSKPTRIQVNAFFTSTDGVFAHSNPECVTYFNVVHSATSPTPTTSPQATKTPTVTSRPSTVPTVAPTSPTATAIPSITPVPGSDFCQDLTVSQTTLYPGGTVTLTAKASNKNITHFSYGLYNRDNEYFPSNPKPIFFTPGKHYVLSQTTTPTDTNSVTLKYSDVNKPDTNANNTFPTRIQVNAFFTSADGVFAHSNPKCVTYFNVVHSNPQTPTPSITPSPTLTPTASPITTSAPSLSPSPTAYPNTQLKICKYEDTNGDGIVNNGEGTIGWNFNYTIDNKTTTVNRNAWNMLVNQGCTISTIPSNKSVTVSEESKVNWIQTAVYADGARIDGSEYTYNSTPDNVKVIWFLNRNLPGATMAPTVTPSPTPTVSNSNYNVTIEKRVDGTRVEGDKVGIQYRIKVKNNSSSRIDELEIRDTLPADFTYDSNTSEGDITANPSIEDVSGDDNRRLLWKNISLESGKELNFGYRTTGKRTDNNFCNDAQVRKNDNILATSQACTRINQSEQKTAVLAATTTRTLPSTGANPWLYSGILLMLTAGFGWRLSKYLE